MEGANKMQAARRILVTLVLGSVLPATSAKADQLVAGGLGTPDTFSLGYSEVHASDQVIGIARKNT